MDLDRIDFPCLIEKLFDKGINVKAIANGSSVEYNVLSRVVEGKLDEANWVTARVYNYACNKLHPSVIEECIRREDDRVKRKTRVTAHESKASADTLARKTKL